MKKIFFFAILAAAFTFAACGNETTEEQPQNDSTPTVDTPAQVDEVCDTPEQTVVEVPEQQVATKKTTKKVEAAPAEPAKQVSPEELKKKNEIAGAKKLDDANKPGTTTLKRNPNAPTQDNGNTLQNNGTSAQPTNKQIGTKKKSL